MKKLFVLLVFVLLSGSAFATTTQESASSNDVTKGWWPGDWGPGDWDWDGDYGRRGWYCEARDTNYDGGGRGRDRDWGPGDWGPGDWDRDGYYYARSRYRDDARDRALERCQRDFDTCQVRCRRENRRENRRYRRY
ncbi:MAG: hypothetical protein ISR65_08290 [Bacteriovoracaceae bacterium]|nr:hypothetical protein [Bacteriovoracaceae bacterium]